MHLETFNIVINAKKRVQLHQQKEHVHTAHKTFCNKMVNLDVKQHVIRDIKVR